MNSLGGLVECRCGANAKWTREVNLHAMTRLPASAFSRRNTRQVTRACNTFNYSFRLVLGCSPSCVIASRCGLHCSIHAVVTSLPRTVVVLPLQPWRQKRLPRLLLQESRVLCMALVASLRARLLSVNRRNRSHLPNLSNHVWQDQSTAKREGAIQTMRILNSFQQKI